MNNIKHRIRVAILKRLSLHNIPVSLENLIDSNEIIDEFGHLPLSNDEKLFVKQQIAALAEYGYIHQVVGYDEVYAPDGNVAAEITEPIDTIPPIKTITTNNPIAIKPTRQSRVTKIPAVVATPLPPLNL